MPKNLSSHMPVWDLVVYSVYFLIFFSQPSKCVYENLMMVLQMFFSFKELSCCMCILFNFNNISQTTRNVSENQRVTSFNIIECCLFPLDDCVKFLKRQAESLDLPVKVYEVTKNKPVVIITWTGTEPTLPTIILNSHMDVVPVFEVLHHHRN